MAVSAGELRRIHAEIGSAEDVINQRRALYSMVHDIVTGGHTNPDLDVDLLDSPAVRGNLGEVLSNCGEYRAEICIPLTGLVAPGFMRTVGGLPVRLASTDVVPEALGGALTRVAAALTSSGNRTRLAYLADPTDAAMATAFERIVDGVNLAVDTAPELALDLLPHVSLFAVLNTGGSDRLGSASAREYPGVVLLPQPESAAETAEALIHEGAHQKFFDLATTRAMFGPISPECRFSPSWAHESAPDWPIEQAFAAWHAYTCLATFAVAISRCHELHEHSLLRYAEWRASELGEWLLGNGSAIGRDGHRLLSHALGRSPSDACRDEAVTVNDLGFDPESPEWAIRPMKGRALIARQAGPLELYWVPQEA